MRLVDRPVARPMRCAAIPYIGQTHRGVRWVDTGSELPGFDNHVYLSSLAVQEAASLLGMPSRADHARLTEQLRETTALMQQAEEECARLRAQLDAVHVLKREGFSSERKRGPKAKEPA